MSNFDENPFGDPTIDNPFADPAVQQVAKNTNNAQKGLDDYNPFADQQPPTGTMAPTQPAIMQATQDPPQYARSGQQTQPPTGNMAPTATTAEFQRRQEELERKAEELQRREEELRQGSYNIRRNNWPPLPAQCPFQPCFYQDIEVDIPLEFQKIVRHLYYLWMFHGSVMVLNVLAGIALMFAGDFSTFGLGVLYFIMFTPFSYLCWFRPAYKAFRSDSSFNFMVFFFIFFFQFVVTVVQFIGMPGSGFCGIILALSTFNSTAGGIIRGLLVLLTAIGFGLAATADLLLISKIHRMYRSSGASFAKAQQEFTSEFMRNQHVQNAASNAAAAAVQAQFNNPPGNRY